MSYVIFRGQGFPESSFSFCVRYCRSMHVLGREDTSP